MKFLLSIAATSALIIASGHRLAASEQNNAHTPASGHSQVASVKDSGTTAPLVLPSDAKVTCAVNEKLFKSWLVKGQTRAFNVPDNAAFSPTGTKQDIDCDFYRQMAHNFLWMTSPETGYDAVFLGSQFQNVVGFEPNGDPIFQKNVKGQTPLARINAVGEAPANSGQRGGAILHSQSGHLVYYGVHVNNVYAALQDNQNLVKYFQDKSGASYQNFPINKRQVQDIATAAGGITFQDENALVIEAKSAWVEINAIPPGLSNSFLVIEAQVPAFSASLCSTLNQLIQIPCTSIWDGKTYKKSDLALVGLHVVAALEGHPELIWSTFEHDYNAPFSKFSYVTAADKLAVNHYNQQTSRATFFGKNTPLSTANSENYLARTVEIADGTFHKIAPFSGGPGTPQNSVVPTNVVISQPFGRPFSASDNVKSVTPINNTLLISMANSLRKHVDNKPFPAFLKHYVQTGAVWSTPGIIPSLNPTHPKAARQPEIIGSPMLANSTMETFFQDSNSGNYAAGCFGCHNTQSGTPH